jgi:hypothetical protein
VKDKIWFLSEFADRAGNATTAKVFGTGQGAQVRANLPWIDVNCSDNSCPRFGSRQFEALDADWSEAELRNFYLLFHP